MTNLKLKLQAIAISASLVSAIPASAQISMEAGGWSDTPLGFSRDAQANRVIVAGGGPDPQLPTVPSGARVR